MNIFTPRVLKIMTILVATKCILPPVVSGQLSKYFLEDIFRFYGENDSLSTVNLEKILQLLETRNPDHVLEGANPPIHSKCLSANDILSQYGLGNVSQLSADGLERICPALLNQAVLPPCPLNVPATEEPLHAVDVWGFGVLAVTIINLAALLGLTLIPFTKKSYFPKVLTYFIGLAIGTLFSNAVLQLIPEALGFDPKSDNYITKAVGIFGGFYLLFVTEKILKMALKTDPEPGHSHFSPPEQLRANSLQNGDVAGKAEVIAVTSFSSVNSDKASVTSEPPTEQVAGRVLSPKNQDESSETGSHDLGLAFVLVIVVQCGSYFFFTDKDVYPDLFVLGEIHVAVQHKLAPTENYLSGLFCNAKFLSVGILK